MAETLFILNDPPYGTERSYHALRLTGSLSKRESEEVKVFLIGCRELREKGPEGAAGVLQHRSDAAKRGTPGRRDRRLRDVDGREGHC